MDISNKFLAFLLVIAIIVMIVGAWYSINKINSLALITGYGTEGYVNLSITNYTSINVTATNCNFGSGYVTAGQNFATLNPGDGVGDCSDPGAYSVDWTNTSEYNPDCIEVKNDGNRMVEVNVSSSKTAATFFGGGTSPAYKMWSMDKEASSCKFGLGLVAYNGTVMDTTEKIACSCLQNEDDNDELYTGCYLEVPNDAPTGDKGDVWTFTATDSESSCIF